jgi:MFS family permease
VIRDRSLLALLAGEFVSRLGSQFTSLALPWFVLVTTGSASKMGLVFAAELAPVALFGIPSASLVQRLGPKLWMVLMDALRVPVPCRMASTRMIPNVNPPTACRNGTAVGPIRDHAAQAA